MYIPAQFREEDLTVLHSLMREYSFATLITCPESGPFASHLPFVLDTERGPYGTLRAHIARANPQWQHFQADTEAMVIFQGPHAYISPAWYTQHPSVPTWNYAVAHAYGVPRVVDDTVLYDILEAIVHQYEAPRDQPWLFSSLTADYIHKMMRGIVGFEMEITRLEGKLKLSQNRAGDEPTGVITALQQTGDPLSAATAEWMRDAAKRNAKSNL